MSSTYRFSAPNDYGSDSDEAAAWLEAGYDKGAIEESGACLDVGDFQAIGDHIQGAIAMACSNAGLEWIADSDYGADWAGTPDQFEAARSALPDWATRYCGEINPE